MHIKSCNLSISGTQIQVFKVFHYKYVLLSEWEGYTRGFGLQSCETFVNQKGLRGALL